MNWLAKKKDTDKNASLAVVTPMTMLQTARDQNASIEQMQQLMEMQFTWEANEARKAYYQAVSAFKSEPILIQKSKTNTQFGSKYSGIDDLVNTVNPILSKHELTANWQISQDDFISVTCLLSHSMGHSDKVTITAPTDKSGSKNPIQEIKSTITYLKIATYEAITGVASSDDPGDTDGNSPVKLINEEQAANIKSLIEEVGDEGKQALFKWLGIDAVDQIPAIYYRKAIQGLEKRRK